MTDWADEKARELTQSHEWKTRGPLTTMSSLGWTEDRIAAALREERAATARKCAEIIEGKRMTEVYIGPLYGAGWNGAIEHLVESILAQFPEARQLEGKQE